MYNRYVPQPDGTYRRNQIADPKPPQPPPKPYPTPCAEPAPPPCPPQTPQPHRKRPAEPAGNTIPGFFRQLLPKDLDTADLLIILLLLLMAGDCEEERNNALLTMALYFFM